MIIRILLLLISLLIYWSAPLKYDWWCCFWCMILYFVQCFLLLKDDFKEKNYLTFNLLFLFSFYWVSFAYPVFIHDTAAAWLGPVSEHINWDMLSKATSLSLVFINCYSLGYGKRKTINKRWNGLNVLISLHQAIKSGLLGIFILLIFNTFLFLATVGIDNAGVDVFMFLYDFFYIFIILACLAIYRRNTFISAKWTFFVKHNSYVLFITLSFVFVYLVIGDRGPVIRVMLILLMIYYMSIGKLKLKKILLAGIAGVCIMFFVRQTREYQDTSIIRNGIGAIAKSSSVFNLDQTGLIYMFADLYGIERELCAGYDYVEKYGYTHTEKILFLPTYALPFLPSIVLGLFGKSTDDYAMGYLLNNYLSDYNPHFGNHVVIDLYMCFGLIGVIIFAVFLGVVSGVLFQRRYDGIYWTTAYIILFSLSVYLPRDSVFSLIRPLSLVFITIFYLKNLVFYIQNFKVRNHAC